MSSDLSEITKFFVTDPEELIALKRRVMGGILPPKGKADAIYCFGGTVDTQDQDLEVGAMLWYAGHAPLIGVLRGNTTCGYCGFEFCRNYLIAHGVGETAIVPVDILSQDQDQLNTHTEGKALLAHARINGWKTLILCAPFFHQMRASSTFVSLLDQQNPEVWVFNSPAGSVGLRERMRHSQGIVEGDLLELLISELGRLFLYHDRGHIHSCGELIAYYDRRDNEFLSHKR